MITKEDLIAGRMPENENEIVLDKLSIDKTLSEDITHMIGLVNKNDFLDKKIIVQNMPSMTIVGITDLSSPAVYIDKSKLINILYHLNFNEDDGEAEMGMYTTEALNVEYDDYNLFKDKITLKEGKWPINDYEVIVNIENKPDMKLNKETFGVSVSLYLSHAFSNLM